MKSVLLAMFCASTGGFVHAQSADVAASSAAITIGLADPGQRWIANEEDNIAGICDLSKVSRPARVDYDALMEATPQMREIRRRDLDPNSPEGKALRKGARILVTKKCDAVRRSGGYCSVWKAITSSDGRAVPDLTDRVLDLIEG
ncbi:MAG TPA: hypothetical protein ENJ09_02955 [Planctomycetes bacterium]|nr:hypothetical protein [Planctomycetota bacterium]